MSEGQKTYRRGIEPIEIKDTNMGFNNKYEFNRNILI
jgi:hypothetical protein